MITEEEIKSFMLAMKKRYDLDFTNYEPKSLSRGVTRLMGKYDMNGMVDLWTRILQDDDFFMSSIDDLMVNLTELFRNPDAWMKIKEEILPNFQVSNHIDVWHAGCSTGEEIISLAILMEECGLFHKSKALATDLSETAIEKAKSGTYSLATLKNYERPFKKMYPYRNISDFFSLSGNKARVKSYYLSKVEFQRDNLVNRKVNRKFDLIFCRNVLIYFDGKLKAKVLEHLESCLKEGGYLILGYYDTMPNQSIDIFDIHHNSSRIYKKKINQTIAV